MWTLPIPQANGIFPSFELIQTFNLPVFFLIAFNISHYNYWWCDVISKHRLWRHPADVSRLQQLWIREGAVLRSTNQAHENFQTESKGFTDINEKRHLILHWLKGLYWRENMTWNQMFNKKKHQKIWTIHAEESPVRVGACLLSPERAGTQSQPAGPTLFLDSLVLVLALGRSWTFGVSG